MSTRMSKEHQAPEGITFRWGMSALGGKGGYVWLGNEAPSDKDLAYFVEWASKPHAMGATVVPGIADPMSAIDKGSLVGRFHPDYTTAWVEDAGSEKLRARRKRNAGGIGSLKYEVQELLKEFGGSEGGKHWKMPDPKYRERGFWYKNEVGQMVSGMPPNAGLTHRRNGVNVEGPKPKSRAAKVLLTHEIFWDDEKQRYSFREK